MHNNKLDDIVYKDNNTYHSTTKMNAADIKSSTYMDLSKKKITEKLPKFKIGDSVRI